MSKNFELMQQAETGLGISVTGERNLYSAPLNGKTNGNGKSTRFNLNDATSREEAFRLVQNIFLLRSEQSPRVVVFAGVDSGNGCSWVCAHAAEALASQNLGSVCLVDANLRSPALPEMFGVSNHFGLTEALSKSGPIRDFTKVIRSDNLSLLSCGALGAESPSLLNSETMKVRVSELRKEFDYVLIDSAPLSTYSDAVVAGQLADGLVLVLEANSTRRESAAKVAESLGAAQVKILGAVLNKRTFPIPEALYRLL
jgi:capsular exopolysaccharide synthesis family protein